MAEIKRIAIIGNGGGGKTTLAKGIAKAKSLPVVHVDSIQFIENWGRRPLDETRKMLAQIATKCEWVIDGFGPMDSIEERVQLADRVIFVDFPLWRHYWWAFKRCVKAFKRDRSELPDGCTEKGVSNMWRLFSIMWQVHKNIRPQLIEIMNKPNIKNKVLRIHTLRDWNRAFTGDFGGEES